MLYVENKPQSHLILAIKIFGDKIITPDVLRNGKVWASTLRDNL